MVMRKNRSQRTAKGVLIRSVLISTSLHHQTNQGLNTTSKEIQLQPLGKFKRKPHSIASTFQETDNKEQKNLPNRFHHLNWQPLKIACIKVSLLLNL